MKKKILIIDDSALMRRVLSDIIVSDERFIIEDAAINGAQALELILANPRKYDAVILDINMPIMNGIQLLGELQNRRIKLNVVVVSTLAKEGAQETLRCLELGAFDFVTKPDSYVITKGNEFKTNIITVLSVATGLYQGSSTDLDRSKARLPLKRETGVIKPEGVLIRRPRILTGRGSKKLVALACSTGGPKALQQVIPLLPANLDAPMLLVQHMPEGFTETLAGRLNDTSKIRVKEAEHGELLLSSTVYIAKGGSQMRVVKQGNQYKITETVEPARQGLRPCADIMFESLLDSDFDHITCVVLTGMGADGTSGIRQLNAAKKNIYVIAQDEASCTVYGMPRALAETGMVDEVVDLRSVADAITRNVGVQ